MKTAVGENTKPKTACSNKPGRWKRNTIKLSPTSSNPQATHPFPRLLLGALLLGLLVGRTLGTELHLRKGGAVLERSSTRHTEQQIDLNLRPTLKATTAVRQQRTNAVTQTSWLFASPLCLRCVRAATPSPPRWLQKDRENRALLWPTSKPALWYQQRSTYSYCVIGTTALLATSDSSSASSADRPLRTRISIWQAKTIQLPSHKSHI